MLRYYTGNENFEDELRLLVSNKKNEGVKLILQYINVNVSFCKTTLLQISQIINNQELIQLFTNLEDV
jgi:hypothetical protein